jgi:hypothetical protein
VAISRKRIFVFSILSFFLFPQVRRFGVLAGRNLDVLAVKEAHYGRYIMAGKGSLLGVPRVPLCPMCRQRGTTYVSAKGHYRDCLKNLANNIPAGEYDAQADKLKIPGSRLVQ